MADIILFFNEGEGKMKNNLACRIFGHKWEATFNHCEYNGIWIKFIGVYCKRCRKGHDELLDAVHKRTDYKYNTYSEKYFDYSL
jgi:hypothetical protein